MATTFVWRPIGLKADQDLDGFVDVVTWVQWQCCGVEILESVGAISAEEEGEAHLQLDPSQPFIPMGQLTDEVVLNWLWSGGVDKNAAEAEVQRKIDLQKFNGVATA